MNHCIHSKTKKNYAPEMSVEKEAEEQSNTGKENVESISIKEDESIGPNDSYEEQDFSNDIAGPVSHKTDKSSIGENVEDYPKDDFVVEHNDLNSEGFEEPTSPAFYKSTDPKIDETADRDDFLILQRLTRNNQMKQ